MTYWSYYKPPQRQNFLKRLWRTAWGVWLLVALMLGASYILVIHTMYYIVGGLGR